MAQRHWTDRRKAAQARMRFRPKPTTKAEEAVIKARYRNDQEESAELEGLRAKLTEKVGKPEKVKAESKTKAKDKPKVKTKLVAKKPVEKVGPKFGEHGHDFNSEED